MSQHTEFASGADSGGCEGMFAGVLERLVSNAGTKRLLIALSETIKDSLGARDCYIADGLKMHLLTPLLKQIYKDVFPYLWGAAAIIVVLLVITLMMLFLQMAIFCRVAGYLA